MTGLQGRFDLKTTRQVIKVSIPLMGGMVGNLVMMLVDRISLARYSPDTLEASGPAVFTAMTLVTFFTAVAGISRSYVAQAFGRSGDRGARHEAALGMTLGAVLALLLFLLAPAIARIPFLSDRPPHIVALESAYLVWAARFGAVMVFNIAVASYFNGIGKTVVPAAIGLAGQAIDILFTVGLVFGYFGLPELGMRGSAIGTLIATSVMMVAYMCFLPSGFFGGFRIIARSKLSFVASRLWLRLRRGLAAGGSQGAEALGQTAFVWIAAVLGTVALSANNVILSVNYLAIVPLIGLGIGCSVLCGQAVGEGHHERIWHIVRITLAVGAAYIVVMSFFQIVTPTWLLAPFGLSDADARTVDVAVLTSRTLWTYSITFLFSMVGQSVLESIGMPQFSMLNRLIFVWCMSVPLIYLVSRLNRGDPDYLAASWLIGSAFEAVIGAVSFWRIGRAVRRQENKLVEPQTTQPEEEVDV
jgi:MATE family, multidrug efflux pump